MIHRAPRLATDAVNAARRVDRPRTGSRVVGIRPAEDLGLGQGWRVSLVPPFALGKQKLGKRRTRPQAAVAQLERGVDPPPGEIKRALDRTVTAVRPPAVPPVELVGPAQDVADIESRPAHRSSTMERKSTEPPSLLLWHSTRRGARYPGTVGHGIPCEMCQLDWRGHGIGVKCGRCANCKPLIGLLLRIPGDRTTGSGPRGRWF